MKKKRLKLDGGGKSSRNFIHIDDVSDATYEVMKKGKNGEIYHISSDHVISIKDLVRNICKKMNYNFNQLVKFSPERVGKDKFYSLSNKKIRKEFKWKPKINLDEGLDKCISWVKTNLNSFSKSDEKYQHKNERFIKESKNRCLNYRKRILDISQKVRAIHAAGAFSVIELVDCIYYGLMRKKNQKT